MNQTKEVLVQEIVEALKESRCTVEFVSKIHDQVTNKGKKLGTKIFGILREKGIDSIGSEIIHLAQEYIGEAKFLEFLQEGEKVTLKDLEHSEDVYGTIAHTTSLPYSFIVRLGREVKGTGNGKGIGVGEALLAVVGKGGRKSMVGDIEIEGRGIEVKGPFARFSEKRTDTFQHFYTVLEKECTIKPKKSGCRQEGLVSYIFRILEESTDVEIKNKINKLLQVELKTDREFSLETPEKLHDSLLGSYLDYFFSTEAEKVTYIAVVGSANIRVYTKDRLREAVLGPSREIKVCNFGKTRKHPEIKPQW